MNVFTALFTNMRTVNFKSRLHNCVNHNYDHKQGTLKHRNTQNGSKSTNHKSQTMIDGSKKPNRQLAFELQNSHVCEKRSN